MGRSFNVARRTGTTAPRIQTMAYATGQTFKKYEVLSVNTSGEVIVSPADPGVAAVVGVAMQGAGTGPGYDLPNSADTTVVTGRAQEVAVAIADREQEFSARGVNGGTDPVVPLQTHIGESYGIAKVGNDWVIDMAEITAKVVEITDIVPGEGSSAGFFLCKFLESVMFRP